MSKRSIWFPDLSHYFFGSIIDAKHDLCSCSLEHFASLVFYRLNIPQPFSPIESYLVCFHSFIQRTRPHEVSPSVGVLTFSAGLRTQ
jgi:hypothetical protein